MAKDVSIKGMVCERCISVIKDGIAELGYDVLKVSLGRISFGADLAGEDYRRIEEFLGANGFEIISTRQVKIVNQAKELISEVFNGGRRYDPRLKLSHLLAEELHLNYDSISAFFTELEGVTIEKYIISKRLEKVKEMLVYSDITLTEIAYATGFSSINHLSRQFKELTGLSPSHFRAIRSEKNRLRGHTG